MSRTAKKEPNTDYDYLLDYISESVETRPALKRLIERAITNYKKHPYVNTYKANAQRYYKIYASDPAHDASEISCMKSCCDSIPEATNDTIFNAVETIVSMTQGGIGQFEYKPVDEYLDKDPELADEQAAFLKYMYEENHLDGMASSTIRKAVLQGQFNWIIEPQVHNGNVEFKVSLIDAYRMLLDPRASKTNRPRFVGYQQVKSWKDLKKNIKLLFDKNLGEYYVKTINDVDLYIRELSDYGRTSAAMRFETEIRQDLDTFSGIYTVSNSKVGYNENGKAKNPITEKGYVGDDVEATYLYDLVNDIYAIIVNRRFVIYTKEHPLTKKIKLQIAETDPETGEPTVDDVDYTVKLDSPIVHRGYIDADWETYPISPLFYCLDDFDNICSKESVLEHNFSIMAPITFMSTAYDAEKVSAMSQIAGQIVEGTQNTLQVMNKNYDLSAISASIQHSEERIKRMMGATDQFELMALMNNRATGAEVSMANGAVSQRMNILLSRLEDGYSELMQKMLKMQIIFSDDDKVFTFPYRDGVSALSMNDLVGNSLVRVKLASRIKVEQQEQSQNALMVLQTLLPLAQQGGVNVKRVIASLVPIITQGVVNRRLADSFVDDSLKIDPAQLNAAMNRVQAEKQRQQAEGVITPDYMANATPEQLDELEQMARSSMGGATRGELLAQDPSQQGVTPQYQEETPPYPSDEGAPSMMVPDQPQPTGADQMTPIPAGMPPAMAGQVANQSAEGVGPVNG